MRAHIIAALVLATSLGLCHPGRTQEAGQPAAGGWVDMFNGQDLEGWTYHLDDANVKLFERTAQPRGFFESRRTNELLETLH